MQAIMRRLKKEEKGFTLIELLAVIVILGVIAVIAVPLIGNIIGDTKEDANLATARQIYDAARLYATAEAEGTLSDVTVATLQNEGYLDSPLYLPSNKQEINGTSGIDVSEEATTFITLTTGTGTNITTVTYTKDQIMAQ